MCCVWVGFQVFVYGEIVDIGYYDIEQNEIDLCFFVEFQCCKVIFSGDDIEIFGEQVCFKYFYIGRDVINDQNVCCYVCIFLCVVEICFDGFDEFWYGDWF